MTDFIRVTEDFAVAPQLGPDDIARAAGAGFKALINNRPDGEAPGQPAGAAIANLAKAAGLAYAHLPFAGPPPAEAIAETEKLLASTPRPLLAFCRTGTRSITVWAYAEVKAGRRTPQDVIERAAAAGYDLSAHAPALARLAQAGG